MFLIYVCSSRERCKTQQYSSCWVLSYVCLLGFCGVTWSQVILSLHGMDISGSAVWSRSTSPARGVVPLLKVLVSTMSKTEIKYADGPKQNKSKKKNMLRTVSTWFLCSYILNKHPASAGPQRSGHWAPHAAPEGSEAVRRRARAARGKLCGSRAFPSAPRSPRPILAPNGTPGPEAGRARGAPPFAPAALGRAAAP